MLIDYAEIARSIFQPYMNNSFKCLIKLGLERNISETNRRIKRNACTALAPLMTIHGGATSEDIVFRLIG